MIEVPDCCLKIASSNRSKRYDILFMTSTVGKEMNTITHPYLLVKKYHGLLFIRDTFDSKEHSKFDKLLNKGINQHYLDGIG